MTGGVLYALLVPPGEQPEPVEIATSEGARGFSVTLGGGRKLMVISMLGAPGQPAPLTDQIPDLARELAAAS